MYKDQFWILHLDCEYTTTRLLIRSDLNHYCSASTCQPNVSALQIFNQPVHPLFLSRMGAQDKNLVHQDSNVSNLDIPEDYKIMIGTYRLEHSEKFEDFMTKLGVSPFMLLSDGVI